MAKRKGQNDDPDRKIAEYISEIESVESEIKQSKETIKASYAKMASEGLDAQAIKSIVKDRKADTEKTAKLRAAKKRYMKLLGTFGDTELGEWASATMAAQRSADNSRPARVVQEEPEAEQTLQ